MQQYLLIKITNWISTANRSIEYVNNRLIAEIQKIYLNDKFATKTPINSILPIDAAKFL